MRRYNSATERMFRERRALELAIRRAERRTQGKPDVLIRAEDAADEFLERVLGPGQVREP